MTTRPTGSVDLWAARGPYRIRVQDYPGAAPAIVLMHGFPDDHHLYDRILPFLAARRVVTFDFLGWGESDKPARYPYTHANQTGDLEAVIRALGLDEVVLVAHDASGPAAIDWALEHPGRVAALVLLNTYYGWLPPLRPPEAIILFSTPILRNVARALMRRVEAPNRWLYEWQVGRFIRDESVRRELVPQFYARFRAARPAFWRLNADLPRTLLSRARRATRLRAFPRPVLIAFGAADPYLNARVARRLARQFPDARIDLVEGAGHYVQVDEPERVAAAVLGSTRPTSGSTGPTSEEPPPAPASRSAADLGELAPEGSPR